MNHIYPFINNFKTFVSPFLKNGAQQISQWKNHIIRFIQLIPQQMQQNSKIAVAVIATTNMVFFFAMRSITNKIDKRLDNQAKPLNLAQRTIKHIFLNGIILGGSVFSANLLLSKITQYPLSKSVVAAITTAAILGRILLNQVGKCFARSEKPVDEEQEINPELKKIDESDESNEPEESPQTNKNHLQLVRVNEPNTSTSVKPLNYDTMKLAYPHLIKTLLEKPNLKDNLLGESNLKNKKVNLPKQQVIENHSSNVIKEDNSSKLKEELEGLEVKRKGLEDEISKLTRIREEKKQEITPKERQLCKDRNRLTQEIKEKKKLIEQANIKNAIEFYDLVSKKN